MAKKSKSKYVLLAKVKQPEKFGWGGGISGGLSGAASGASMGSMFGPWGTAIGAVAGGAYRAVTGSKQEDEQAKLLKEQQAQQLLAQQQMQNQSGIVPNYMPNGGTVPIYYARGTKDDTGKINTSYYQTNMPYKKGQKINPYATATNMGSNPQIITPDVYQNALKQFPNQIGYGPVTGDLNTTFENRLIPQAAQPIKPGMQQAFPNGGTIKEDDVNYNAQLEKQEVFQEPDGTTEQVEAPSHQNGGINLNLEQGTRVYSDRLKSKNGITFAKEAEAFKTNKFEKTLEDNKADQLKKKTAQLMLEKNKRALDRIFEEQEAQKDDNFANDVFAFGGTMMYKDGGIHIKPENRGKFTAAAKRAGKSVQEYASQILAHKENYSSTLVKRANFARNASKFKHADGGHIELNRLPTYFADGGTKQAFLDRAMDNQIKIGYYAPGGTVGDTPWENPPEQFDTTDWSNSDRSLADPLYKPKFDFQANPGGMKNPFNGTGSYPVPGSNPNKPVITPFGTTPPINNTGPNWGKLGTEAAIGIAGNIGPAAYLAEQGDKYDKQSFYNYNPNTLDPTNALRDVDQSTSALRSAIPGTTGGSGNLAINALLANKLQGDQTKSNIRAEYDRANAGIRNQGQQFNIGNRYRTDDINAANKGQALTNKYQALGMLGRNVAQQGRDIQTYGSQENVDKMRMKTLEDLYSNYTFDNKSGHWIPRTK